MFIDLGAMVIEYYFVTAYELNVRKVNSATRINRWSNVIDPSGASQTNLLVYFLEVNKHRHNTGNRRTLRVLLILGVAFFYLAIPVTG